LSGGNIKWLGQLKAHRFPPVTQHMALAIAQQALAHPPLICLQQEAGAIQHLRQLSGALLVGTGAVE
jgi:hypothetical protein